MKEQKKGKNWFPPLIPLFHFSKTEKNLFYTIRKRKKSLEKGKLSIKKFTSYYMAYLIQKFCTIIKLRNAKFLHPNLPKTNWF